MDIRELQAHKYNYINRHPWELTRLKIIEYFLKKHAKGIDHLLDVGCGDAFVLKQLQYKKVSKYYTAIDNAFTAEMQQQLIDESRGIHFYSSLPETLNPKSNCVLLLDVIEHCDNDAAVLQSILKQSVSTNDAKIFITVPAFQQLFSQHDVILGHYRRYSMRQLQELCQNSGLRIIEKGYFFFSLLTIRGIQCLLEKNMNKKLSKTINNWEASKWLTKSIIAGLWLDFLLSRLFLKIGIRIPGLSLYCICQK